MWSYLIAYRVLLYHILPHPKDGKLEPKGGGDDGDKFRLAHGLSLPERCLIIHTFIHSLVAMAPTKPIDGGGRVGHDRRHRRS